MGAHSVTASPAVTRAPSQDEQRTWWPPAARPPSGWEPNSGASSISTLTVDGERLLVSGATESNSMMRRQLAFSSDNRTRQASPLSGLVLDLPQGLMGAFDVSGCYGRPLIETRTLLTAFETQAFDFWDPSGAATGVSFSPLNSDDDRFRRLSTELDARHAALVDWDAEAGDPPNDRAFHDALDFLRLIPIGVPDPSIYVSGDAEVGFSWMLPSAFVEVAFRGDDNIRYTFRFGADPVRGDVTPLWVGGMSRLPLELRNALVRI